MRSAKFRCRSVAAAGDLLFFVSPKKPKEKKGDPGACVPSLLCGQPAVHSPAGVPLALATFHSARTIAAPYPSGFPLLAGFTRVFRFGSDSGSASLADQSVTTILIAARGTSIWNRGLSDLGNPRQN